jgi:Tol biopolymer transport system component
MVATIVIVGLLGAATSTEATSPVQSCATASVNSQLSFLSINGNQMGVSFADASGASTGCFLKFNKATPFSLAWSPNGKWLGFVLIDSTNPSSPKQDVYAVTADGQTIRQVAPSTDFTFSPMNDLIAYSNNGDIWSTTLQGGQARNLTQKGGGAFSPAWSPKGNLIAYSQPDGLYVMDAMTGSNPRNLTKSPNLEDDQFPVWSPDGQWIAFTSKRVNNIKQVYVVNVATGALQLVSDGKTLNDSPTWSPDSKQIAFTSAPGNLKKNDTRIMIGSVNGGAVRRLTQANQVETSPAWSYDGKQVAFVVNLDKRGNQKIYLINADGTGIRQLTKSAGVEESPRWQPR